MYLAYRLHVLPRSVPSGVTASDSTAINVLISRVTPDFNGLLCISPIQLMIESRGLTQRKRKAFWLCNFKQ
jgi:beta-lactamase class A